MSEASVDDRRLVAGIKHAYEVSADGWAHGPSALYRRLAQALVAVAARPLVGRSVLDLGAGTGVASEVLTEAGARPIGVDLAWPMLAYRSEQRPPAVVGDAQALPFRDAAFDGVVAAFCLNHLPDPATGLAECRRVTRPGGVVLASTFPSEADHPAKAVVESALERFGYQRPRWYETLKQRVTALTGDLDALEGVATDAGLADIEVMRIHVEAGLDEPEVAVAWRLGMPHTVGFVASLAPQAQATLRSQAVTALNDRFGQLPSEMPILILRANAPSHKVAAGKVDA